MKNPNYTFTSSYSFNSIKLKYLLYYYLEDVFVCKLIFNMRFQMRDFYYFKCSLSCCKQCCFYFPTKMLFILDETLCIIRLVLHTPIIEKPEKLTNWNYLHCPQKIIQIYPTFFRSLHSLQEHQQRRGKPYTNGYIHKMLLEGL